MVITLKTPEGKPYVPLPKQAAFHGSDATYRAYVGGFGSGKTLCGCMESLMTALEYPGSTGLVGRFTYRELMKTTWKTLVEITPPELVVDINKKDPSMTLKNGSVIEGWNLLEGKNLRSLNLDWFHLDEITEIERDVYNDVAGRLRGLTGPRRGWCTGNPAGRDWVWKLFVDQHLKGHAFFHAPTSENIHLPSDYIDNLRLFYDEDWISKYLQGSFDVFEGQILDTFKSELHVVPPFAPPPEWPRFRGLDHGWTNPTACVWLARDFEGNYLVYRVYYKRNSIPAENSAAILHLSEGETIDWTVMDPQGRQTQVGGGTAERIVDQYQQAGLYCQLGNNDVRASISLIRQLLQPNPERPFPAWHPRAGELGAPLLFITADCDELTFEIQQWQWKQVRPGGIDKETPLTRHDHAIAALRYLLMNSPRPAQETLIENQYERFLQVVREMEGKPLHDPDEIDFAEVIGNQHLRVGRV